MWERGLPRDADAEVCQVNRVIVHREQLGSYRRLPNPLERGLPANEALRSVSHTASSFIAGKRAPTNAYLKCVGLDIKVI